MAEYARNMKLQPPSPTSPEILYGPSDQQNIEYVDNDTETESSNNGGGRCRLNHQQQQHYRKQDQWPVDRY
jgi:hypothetical protein